MEKAIDDMTKKELQEYALELEGETGVDIDRFTNKAELLKQIKDVLIDTNDPVFDPPKDPAPAVTGEKGPGCDCGGTFYINNGVGVCDKCQAGKIAKLLK